MVAPVVPTYQYIEVEHIPAATINTGLRGIADEVVVVDLVVVAIIVTVEVDSTPVVRGGVACQGVVAGK